MAGNKYFYDGIPLSKYCKDHGIKLSTITARIWKKKQSKKIWKLYGSRKKDENLKLLKKSNKDN